MLCVFCDFYVKPAPFLSLMYDKFRKHATKMCVIEVAIKCNRCVCHYLDVRHIWAPSIKWSKRKNRRHLMY